MTRIFLADEGREISEPNPWMEPRYLESLTHDFGAAGPRIQIIERPRPEPHRPNRRDAFAIVIGTTAGLWFVILKLLGLV